MSNNLKMTGCEDIAKICALATAESLAPEERERLASHIAECSACEQLLREYRELASSGMSSLAAEEAPEETASSFLFPVVSARERLVAAMEERTETPIQQPVFAKAESGGKRARWFFNTPNLVRVAAILILTGVVSYRAGMNVGKGNQASTQVESVRSQLSEALSQKTELESKLESTTKRISQLQSQVDTADKQLSDLKLLKTGLEGRIAELTTQKGQQSASIVNANNERAALEVKLNDAEAALHSVRQQLQTLEDDRRQLQVRTTGLETQVEHFSSQLDEQQDLSNRQQQFLAQDRDIRELMGARQLYIADVFDVDSQGNNRKPFGRVFFTKGKSLIFYAFDLDKQPGYRNASAFQAWGQPGAGQANPVSLGIFYMDSEANRRWVLQASDPKVLEQISSVFVTVEPKGGSKKPTNRPFLLAYLHATPPNHP